MGLRQDRIVNSPTTSHWWFPLVASIISATLVAGGETWQNTLKYDRLAIAEGEIWRLVSGHFAHLGPGHFLLNIAALWLIWFLVGRRLDLLKWCLVALVILTVIDAGFWYLDTNLLWYVGLSGLLHGLLITGALAGIRTQRTESIVIIVVIFAKLAYEQSMGPLPGSTDLAGGSVVVNAHLYGAAGGVLAGWPVWRSAKGQASI